MSGSYVKFSVLGQHPPVSAKVSASAKFCNLAWRHSAENSIAAVVPLISPHKHVIGEHYQYPSAG
jgi:hypothetical protein